jgi:hypothetical protein
MGLSVILTTTIVLTAPLTLAAAELPVSYLVEAKPFKKNVSAGDQLTFELYSDPNCETLVHSEQVTAGSPELIVEKVITQKVKGQSPAPPKGMRLSTTLTTPDVGQQVFVQVIGDGITPVGNGCQAQAASAPVPQQRQLRVYDETGRDLGPFVDIGVPGAHTVTLFHEGLGVFVRLAMTSGDLTDSTGTEFLFADPACVGPVYTRLSAPVHSLMRGQGAVLGRLFVREIPGEIRDDLYWLIPSCEPASSQTVYPLIEVDPNDIGFTLPVPPPLTVRPAAE